MTTKRSHEGIAHREGERRGPVGHPASPSTPDPRRAVCATCGSRLQYRRRTYGPNGRAGGWAHSGDGLQQYRAWGTR
jgi:hypothetical protein